MATIRYGVSPWIHRVPPGRRPTYPRLQGHHEVDVAIVGGGLTGCLTAQALAAAGLSIILLEAQRIGEGATGHASGLALLEPQVDFGDLTRARGLRPARSVWRACRRATQDLAATLRRLNVRCDLMRGDLLEVELGPEIEPGHRRSLETRADAGSDARWLDARALAPRTNGVGLAAARLPGNAAVDPYRACLGLARAGVKRGAAIHERSELVRVRAGSDAVEIGTPGGSVEAQTVVVATGALPQPYRPLRRHLTPAEHYLVITQPLAASVRRQLGRRDVFLRDSASPPHYLRWTPDGRVIFSGADQPAPHPRWRQRVLVQRTGQLMYELSTLYPAISGLQPAYGWRQPYGATRDGLPIVGPHRHYPRHLFAIGGQPTGLGLAQLASRIILRHLRDESTKDDDPFGFSRT
jgi:glycine/D-amino acid oxidase-like deaminating enzyme